MRLGVPILALGHTLLAMALALTFGNVTGRRGAGGQFVIIAIPVVHIAFLVLLQTLLRADARLIVVLAALALLEILASLFMIWRLNSPGGVRALSHAPARRSGDLRPLKAER